jgi:hypothetical protein
LSRHHVIKLRQTEIKIKYKKLLILGHGYDRRGLYTGKNSPTVGRKKISRCHLRGKYRKRGREKGGKCKTKRRKGKIKRKKEDRKRENRK